MKYTCNENFFNIDSPESLYWAGFIAADGCVAMSQSCSYLRIILSSVDKDMLYKFAGYINYTGEPKNKDVGGKLVSVLQISKPNVVKSLERFNIFPNKTKTYSFPKWLKTHKLVDHFMRGYVDGDGSFFITKQSGRNHLNFSLCGTKEFLNDFRDVLVEKCDLKLNKICKSKGIHDLRYSGNINTFKIREFLYRSSVHGIRMGRKYNKSYDPSLKIIPKNRHRFRKVAGHSLVGKNTIVLETMAYGKQLGFDPKAIWACCAGRRKTHKNYIWSYVNGG